MGKTLVLAEKPSVGREIARVLGAKIKTEGAIKGDKYIVTWALGHLITLADPEHYDVKYKKWALDTLPMLPDKTKLVVMRETAKQFKIVKSLLDSPDISEVVIATDAGREGELVARWIINKAGYRGRITRLWISSQTDRAIREGFTKLKPGEEYLNLYKSAECRALADWYVGLNVTRALTCKYNAQLSAGRVQTPTLAMIVAREREIESFVPKEFYTVEALVPGFSLTYRDKKTGQQRIFDKERANSLADKLKGEKAKIVSVKKDKRRTPPPLLYDLTELQRDANRKYGMSAKDTLNTMQRLYETYKYLTYPRTDSRYLSQDIVPSLKERVASVMLGEYEKHAKAVYKKGITASKRFVDDSKVSDHHAIIPTEENVNLNVLNADERRIYDLVIKRFLAVLSEDYEYLQTTVKADIAGESFYAKGRIVESIGWKAVYDSTAFIEDEEEDLEESEQTLPVLNSGQVLEVKDFKVKTGKTSPPSRYTEATLLTAMEHPGKFIENTELRDIVDTAGGIGTPATRADIIEKLFTSSYIERRGKSIVPLSKGIQLIDLVPGDLKSPALTAQWEQKLLAISKGSADPKKFVDEIKKYASKLVSDVIASSAAYRHDNLTKTRCPVCDKFMLEVNGKKGKLLVCEDRECGYRQSLSYLTNARCPTCHKKLEVFGEGEKKIYICKCGFREKFDVFNKRMSENRAGTSKREVERYLEKQEREKNENTAFAEAWARALKEHDG